MAIRVQRTRSSGRLYLMAMAFSLVMPKIGRCSIFLKEPNESS